ncbi:hypothetical protein ACKKBG_A33875 [Auxenochlorella protothecoides x Auxenochlorella symbiontica]|uniref:Rhodanese domain-containing protein n=1 Tax=Auxenochlorella protothecoides TaxID=3075 RepID=A0A1D2A0J2_AUXPR
MLATTVRCFAPLGIRLSARNPSSLYARIDVRTMASGKVSVQEAAKLSEEGKYTYLDVRTEKEFAASHPKGASNIQWAFAGDSGFTPNPDFVSEVKAAYDNLDTPLLIACQAGRRSAAAAAALEAAGYTQLKDVEGGFGAWTAAGLPTES